MLGLGAAWYEAEAMGLGLCYPPLAERFERLEETLQVCRQMWSGSQAGYAGRIEKTSTMLFDVGKNGERADELPTTLRELRDDGITAVYGRMKADGYVNDIEVIGRDVIPVIAGW